MGDAKFTVPMALLGWVPLVIILFATMSPRKALLIGMVGGYMFLPVYVMKIKAVPEFSKLTAASYACLLGTMLFDFRRLFSFKFGWFDIPMFVFCCSPYLTSIQNELGWYDGVSSVIHNFVIWGLPYYLGRIYFPDWDGIKDLGKAIFFGGLIYIPLCLIEIRMSPQLHHELYGYHQHDFSQTARMGGFRPMVFLQHGLAVGMWMTSASMIGIWMWQCKTIRNIKGIPVIIFVGLLFVTTVLCKSTGGLLFLMAGVTTLYSIKFIRMPILLLGIICVAPTYMIVRGYLIHKNSDEIMFNLNTNRAVGEPIGEKVCDMALKMFGQERAQSLETRIRSENRLAARAFEQPYFGWGRWNRNRVYDRLGKDAAPTDGLWVITLGVNGIVGLAAFTLVILTPPMIIWLRCPMKYWDHPGVAPAAALAVLLSLYMMDNILNAMPDPVFTLAIGALSGVAPSIRKQAREQRRLEAAQRAAYPSPQVMAPGLRPQFQ